MRDMNIIKNTICGKQFLRLLKIPIVLFILLAKNIAWDFRNPVFAQVRPSGLDIQVTNDS